MNYTESLLSSQHKLILEELLLPRMIFLLYHLFWQIVYRFPLIDTFQYLALQSYRKGQYPKRLYYPEYH